MNDNLLNNSTSYTENESLDIKKILLRYLKSWKWFLLSIISCLVVVFIYLRYAQPQYKSSITIIIKSSGDGDISSKLLPFSSLGITGSASEKDNQIEILKSRSLSQSVVKKLNLNVIYFKRGNIKQGEVYHKESPVKAHFLSRDSLFYQTDTIFRLTGKSLNQYNLVDKDSKIIYTANYGQKLNTKLGTLIIYKNEIYQNQNEDFIDFEIDIHVNSLQKTVEDLRKKITVIPVSKSTDLVEISMIGSIKSKTVDYLNALVKIYNEEAIDDEKQVSQKTINFIDDRLTLITSELGDLEQNTEDFKKKNKVTDIVSEAGLYLKTANEYEQRSIKSEIDLSIIDSMIDWLSKISKTDLIPVGISPKDANTDLLISEYNKQLIDRNRILSNSSIKNPIVRRYDESLDAIRNNISESLKALKKSINITKGNVENQGNVLDNRISQIPKKERQFREIMRKQEIKEAIFLFLVQKREEAALQMEIASPISKVIDTAFSNDVPISPNKKFSFIVSVIIGLLIPIFIIYIIDLLDTKVKSRKDVERFISDLPYLGDVPRLGKEEGDIVAHSRTSTAEALRMVRTNADFMVSNKKANSAKVIFTSSTIPGEGKTFISFNLSKTISFTGKNVLLLGFDIRNPKLDEYMNLPVIGVTNYLLNDGVQLDNIIVKHPTISNFSVIPSGIIPPNPSELLLSPRVDVMFEELKKQYDYILVDTAPLSLVTDTFLISKHADLFIYVVRANYLEKNMLQVMSKLYSEKKLTNLSFVINDSDESTNQGFGYGYGVYTNKVKKKWYQKLI